MDTHLYAVSGCDLEEYHIARLISKNTVGTVGN